MRCYLCQSEKNLRDCDACAEKICRECATFLEPERFRFHPSPPALWSKNHFCLSCFDEKIAPDLAHYDDVLARSAEVTVVSKAFRGQVPCKKKKQGFDTVKDHLDQKIAVAHLKFLATWEGFDAVVSLETKGTKMRRHGYQHLEWAATGNFANLDHRRFRPD